MTLEDSEANPAGGLAVRFWGRDMRSRGVPATLIAERLDWDAVRALVCSLIDRELVPWSVRSSAAHADDALALIVNPALQLLALEHRECLECEVDHWSVPNEAWEPALQGRWFGVDAMLDVLADDLCHRRELLFDFLCALVQAHPRRDRSAWFRLEPGTASDLGVRDLVQQRLNDGLRSWGWQLVDGFPVSLGTDSEDPAPLASWAEVDAKLAEATAELAAGDLDDAITDIGTALQLALQLAGCQGKTLGEQVKAVRQRDLFQREHSKLAVALEALPEWIASVRNQKGDAHPGAAPTTAEALLAVRMVRALAHYLASP